MDLLSYIEKGGIIGYILLAMLTIGLTTTIWKYFQIIRSTRNRSLFIQELIGSINQTKDKALILNYVKSSLEEKLGDLEKGMGLIKTIATLAPLLGLLGTVIGILVAFETIASSGMGDTTTFAGGISLALVTTILGLIISIPHYVGYNFLAHKLDTLEALMNKDADTILIGKEK